MAARINVEPRLVRAMVESHPKLQEMRNVLETRYGASKEQSGEFVHGLLGAAVQRVGAKYADAMAQRLAHLFDLREQAALVVEDVIGPTATSPEAAGAKLSGLFNGMKDDMAAISDPASFAKKTNLKADPDIAKDVDDAFREYEKRPPKLPTRPGRTGKAEPKLDMVQRKVAKLSRPTKRLMARTAEFAPHELWKAVTSESPGEAARYREALLVKARSLGMTPDEITALERAVMSSKTGPVTSRPLQRGFLRFRFRAEESTWGAFDAMPEGHAVYRVRNAHDEVIYVGITSRTGWERWGEHLEQKGGEWLGQASQFEFVATGLATEKLALALEDDIMAQAKPEFNKQWTYRSRFGGPPGAADIPSFNANLVLQLSHE